ncbi:hypothetical protein KJ567_00340 [Candidatus Bipolaricaulota bacterium]|nr:hypothetical protein [Candidatus Bipolaricaulota bacterium]
MRRDSIGKATTIVCVMTLLVMGMLSVACSGQNLELIAPVVSETLQYGTDDFVLFFSPEVDDNGLVGLRLSITSTLVDAMSIEWRESYFILPNGERSDAITDDVPTSFQMSPTDIYARQTAEVVAIPLSSVSLSKEGWSVAQIEAKEGEELTLHLAVRSDSGDTGQAIAGHDFTFRAIDADEPRRQSAGLSVWLWPALIAGAVGFLLGQLAAEL